MISTVLVDDEPDATLVLQSLLTLDFPDIEVVATYHKASEAIKNIPILKPQLVFLDIEMPGTSGLEVLKALQKQELFCVFFTAHEKYALHAIKLDALDYLLKPLDPEELAEVISKVRLRMARNQIPDYSPLLNSLYDRKLLRIPTGKGWQVVPAKEIVYIKAEGNYSVLHLLNNSQVTVIKLLRKFEEELEPLGFIRPHNSYLINTLHIKEYLKAYGGSFVMHTDVEIPLSKKYKHVLKGLFST